MSESVGGLVGVEDLRAELDSMPPLSGGRSSGSSGSSGGGGGGNRPSLSTQLLQTGTMSDAQLKQVKRQLTWNEHEQVAGVVSQQPQPTITTTAAAAPVTDHLLVHHSSSYHHRQPTPLTTSHHLHTLTATGKRTRSGASKSQKTKSKRRKVVVNDSQNTRSFFHHFEQLNSQLEDEGEDDVDENESNELKGVVQDVTMQDVEIVETESKEMELETIMNDPCNSSTLPVDSSSLPVATLQPPSALLDSSADPTMIIPHSTSPSVGLIPSSLPPLHRAKTTARIPLSPKKVTTAATGSTSRSVPNSPAKVKDHDHSPTTPAIGLFEGLRFILLQGPELTTKRCDLLALQISRRGGKVIAVSADPAQPEREPLKMKHVTHLCFGGVNGDYGRVREYAQQLQTQMKPKHFQAITYVSVEWIISCLKKNALSRLDRYEWKLTPTGFVQPHLPAPIVAQPQIVPVFDPMTMDPLFDFPQPVPTTSVPQPHHFDAPSSQAPIITPSFSLPPASAAALNAAATHGPKRDIRYVMEEMSRREQAQTQNISTESAACSLPPLEPAAAASSSASIKFESGGPMLDSATLQRAKREHSYKRSNSGWKPPKPLIPSIPTSSSTSPPVPMTDALAQTYTQEVPTFTETVPYDASKYLPLSTGASYLNPDLRAPIGASFLEKPPEFTSDSASSGPTQDSTGTKDAQDANNIMPPLESASSINNNSYHPLPQAKTAGAWIDRNKAHLACQIFSSQHRNLNPHLTGPLEKLESMNGSIGDKWRTYAYRKAVGILKKYPQRISTQEDVLKLAGIRGLGSKILKKVSEIISTGTLKKVKDMESNEMIKTMELFSKIHGVGAATAQKWYTWGLRTIDDLLTDERVELNSTQKVGLQFVDDHAQRIPRLEVTSILDYVSRIANRILPGVTVICCGSFRRGAPTSGDVDLLFTHPTFTHADLPNEQEDPASVKQREGFLRKILSILHEPLVEGSARWNEEKAWSQEKYQAVKDECDRIKADMSANEKNNSPQPAAAAAAASSSSSPAKSLVGRTKYAAWRPPQKTSFLTGDLSTFEHLSSRHGSAYYMGFCALPKFHPFHSGVNRRIDMKVYPASHFPFALLYFTGSDHFNRSMRFFAKKKMWTLSDHGLAPAIRVNGDKVWSGKSVYCATEKDIFDALGLLYVPPEQRNVYAHFELTEEEIRILKQNNTLQAGHLSNAKSEVEQEEEDAIESAQRLRQLPQSYLPNSSTTTVAAAADASSSSTSSSLGSGYLIKQEVKDELLEMDAVARAALGLKRLAEEEAAIFRNQLAQLDGTTRNKQV